MELPRTGIVIRMYESKTDTSLATGRLHRTESEDEKK